MFIFDIYISSDDPTKSLDKHCLQERTIYDEPKGAFVYFMAPIIGHIVTVWAELSFEPQINSGV